MNKRQVQNIVKQFGMTNQLLLSDLSKIAHEKGVPQLVEANFPSEDPERDLSYFNDQLVFEAKRMSSHYLAFYCLERSIRELISDVLESVHGPQWWEITTVVPDHVRREAKQSLKREKDAGVTPRSDDPIDFTTFGHLSDIIQNNTDSFGSVLQSIRGAQRVLATLNNIRSPIAHCSPLAPDEEDRLSLSLRDWFRLLE